MGHFKQQNGVLYDIEHYATQLLITCNFNFKSAIIFDFDHKNQKNIGPENETLKQ